jgi:hypothetical protein
MGDAQGRRILAGENTFWNPDAGVGEALAELLRGGRQVP